VAGKERVQRVRDELRAGEAGKVGCALCMYSPIHTHVSSSSYDMYPPPHMTCTLIYTPHAHNTHMHTCKNTYTYFDHVSDKRTKVAQTRGRESERARERERARKRENT
jgi:hypothetical protein